MNRRGIASQQQTTNRYLISPRRRRHEPSSGSFAPHPPFAPSVRNTFIAHYEMRCGLADGAIQSGINHCVRGELQYLC